MTLIIRNRLLFTFSIISVIFITAVTGCSIVSIVNGTAAIPEQVERLFVLPETVPLLSYNFFASVSAIVLLTLYACGVTFILYVNFEKTQSPEIIYFTGFLCGCLLEGVRLCLPIFNLWQYYVNVYIFIGRVLFFGKMLAVLSFVFLVLLSIKQNAQQDADKNILVILAAAGGFSVIIPIDTLQMLSNCSVKFGYGNLFTTLTVICIIVAFTAMRLYGSSIGSAEYRKASVGYAALITGYAVLTIADAFLIVIAGAVLLFAGTAYFLKKLHNYYMWK